MSYAHRDFPFAQRLVGALTLAAPEFKFVSDITYVNAGDDIFGSIAEAIDHSDGVIFIITPNSGKSAWVNAEIAWTRTRAKGIPLFPVVVGDVIKIPDLLSGILYLKFDDHDPFEGRVAVLVSALKAAISDQPRPSTDGKAIEFLENESTLLRQRMALELEFQEKTNAKILKLMGTLLIVMAIITLGIIGAFLHNYSIIFSALGAIVSAVVGFLAGTKVSKSGSNGARKGGHRD